MSAPAKTRRVKMSISVATGSQTNLVYTHNSDRPWRLRSVFIVAPSAVGMSQSAKLFITDATPATSEYGGYAVVAGDYGNQSPLVARFDSPPVMMKGDNLVIALINAEAVTIASKLWAELEYMDE